MSRTSLLDRANLNIYADADRLQQACAEHIIALAHAAIDQRGSFHIALSGGSTPRALYALLATPACAEQLDWPHIHVYFGDERAVPDDHPDSNYRMARAALLDHVSLPADNIHPMSPHPETIQQSAAAYSQLLLDKLPHSPGGLPQFDLVLLGLGTDGHTASLFPDTEVLGEQHALVAPVYVEKLGSWRLTLTYPVINAARELLFLVAGQDKATIVRQLFSGQPPDVPSAGIRPTGTVHWMLDEAAAKGLET
jgi:6-phosphogluconolactonase